MKVIYLDFDGVLHSDEVYQDFRGRVYLRGPGQLFEHAGVLLDVLAPYPDVRIMLSTSWVRLKGYGWVLKRLPEDLRSRVIGATWHSMFGKDWNEQQWWQSASRYQQILRDMQRRQPARWLAIDDDLEGWPDDDRAHVVGCSPLIGLSGEAAQAKLKTKLEVWR
jgi:hypothetical protein